MIEDLAGPVLTGDARPRSRYIDNDSSYWATYFYSAQDITAFNLNDVWSWRVTAAVTTVSFTRTDSGDVKVQALVRTDTAQIPALAPTVYLNPVPGQQVRAAVSCVPGAPRLSGVPAADLDSLGGSAIPIGPAGILVGTLDAGDQHSPVLLPLADPDHSTRIRVNDPDSSYLRQLLLRAAAVGQTVAVYSDDPWRWAGLSGPLIEIHESPSSTANSTPAIVVKDRVDGQPHQTPGQSCRCRPTPPIPKASNRISNSPRAPPTG